METIFKLGDKVFHYEFGGWGEVIDIFNNSNRFPIYCSFPEVKASFTWDGRYYETRPTTLSFTEYTLEGFSQERPEDLPNRGDIVWVRNEFPGNWAIGHFYKKVDDYYYVSDYVGQKEWSKRGFEMTTKNPYANEQ